MGAKSLVEAAGVNGVEQRKHTLLIVDDEVDVLESLRHQFHRTYRVLTSVSGSRAIEILQQDDVDLILSDQRMPGMSGDIFLRQARQLKPDAIRMLFTGYADIQAVINAVNEGHIFRYILKPWDTVELEGIIRQGVEQCDLLAERRRLITQLQTANAQLLQANEELARAGQLKTAFIEVASHEFNTPITLVLGLTELLRLGNPLRPDDEQEILRQITTSGRQLARLVTNMLTLLRAEDFRRTLLRSPLKLVDLIERVVDQVRPFLLVRQIRLHAELADDLGTFEIDGDKISAVLINLLTNAIKFTPDGGQIELVARCPASDAAEIYVEDRGVGLEPQALKHLFQPFFTQFDPSRHSSGDFGFCKRGLGLGLSIARQFVDMHGGRIEAASREGGGTRITLHLPRRGNQDDQPRGRFDPVRS
jgi:signal transduction histidine kinase